jgi:hypothetical protein
MMSANKQVTGMRGVYIAAAELSRLGFVVAPTSRGARGTDLLVANQLGSRAFSVQVKANAKTFGFWLIGKYAKDLKSESHVYVFVNFKPKETEYYVVPAKVVSDTMIISDWTHIRQDAIAEFKDAWDVFGEP